MMITLLNLKWGNCCSYGEDNELNLADNPITQLVGINGAGKTTIPLLIQEVLFGKNIRGIKKADIPNRYTGISGYWINLIFKKYDDTYEIKLSRSKSKLTLNLYCNAKDISSHTAVATYKTISNIIGFSDFKMVSQLLYQSSNTSLEFLTATDTNRKKFLVSLLNLHSYLDIHEEFKDIAKEINKDIISAKATLDHINSWINTNSKIDLTLIELKEEILVSEALIESISNIKSKILNIKEINRDIVTNNTYISDLNSLDTSLLNYIKQYDKDKVALLTESLGRIKAVSSEAGRKKAKFAGLEGIKECPTCLSEVDEESISSIIDSASKDIRKYSLEALSIQSEIKDMEALRLEDKYARKVEVEFIRLTGLIRKDLSRVTLDLKELNNELKEKNSDKFKEAEAISKVDTFNKKAIAHNSKIEVISNQIKEFRVDKVKKEKVYNKAQEEKSYVEIIKNAFSTNGLLSYKIESSVKVLENCINDYLAEFCFFRLVFILEGEKLNVAIVDDTGSNISIETLSTGELARVNISTVLAIRKVMTALASSNINFLFLDEIVGVLDDNGKEKLSEILMREGLNTFIVSHESTHPLIPKILIEKNNNISRLTDG